MSHPGEWLQERVDAAHELWDQGLTASQIARELGGGITRNAVIGQAHRRSWQARKSGGSPSQAAAENRHRTRRLTHAPKTRNALLTINLRRARRRSQPVPKPATAALARIPIEDLVEPASLGVPLLELTGAMCRWPVGDPRDPDFAFCGHRNFNSLPYCEYHARVAYQPVYERRRGNAYVAEKVTVE